MNIRASRRRSVACLLLAAAALVAALPAVAAPMEYKGTIVTNIKIGKFLYKNAAVTITFVGDTKDIATVPVTSQNCGDGWFFWLPKGNASVSVESDGRTHVAHLETGQLFIALDVCNGGIGFGSYTGPNGLEPAYPLGFHHGTAETAASTSEVTVPCCSPTSEVLTTPANMSGDAWSCIGYPPDSYASSVGTGQCADPSPYPLKSDLGEVFIYQLYVVDNNDGTSFGGRFGTLNRGTFSISTVVGE